MRETAVSGLRVREIVSGAGDGARTRDPLLGKQMPLDHVPRLASRRSYQSAADVFLSATNNWWRSRQSPSICGKARPKNGGHFVAMFAGKSRYEAGSLVLLDRHHRYES